MIFLMFLLITNNGGLYLLKVEKLWKVVKLEVYKVFSHLFDNIYTYLNTIFVVLITLLGRKN